MESDTPSRARINKWFRFSLQALAALSLGWVLNGCAAPREISWAPNGKALAYCPDGRLRIYDVESKRSTPLYTNANASWPAWSPDGKAIAFYAISEGNAQRVAVRVIELASGRVRTLIADVLRAPKLAHDAKRRTGSGESATLGQDESRAAILSISATIAWSPDATRLAYLAMAPVTKPITTVLIADYPSGRTQAISNAAEAAIALAWSPDGQLLAYVSAPASWLEGRNPGAGKQRTRHVPRQSLWLYDLQSASRTKVCDLSKDGLAVGTRLVWSPDSNEIGFIAERGDSGADAYIVEARRQGAVVDVMKGVTSEAVWSPALTGVAFLEQREDDEVVLLFRGVRPVTRKAIGSLRVTPLETFPDQPQQGQEPPAGVVGPYSLPEFSPDGRWVALRAGQSPKDMRLEMFQVR